MKKIIKLPIESTTQIRKTEDSLCELYSHDKNNGLFEFEVTNVKLGNEKPYAMFKFMDSMSVWKVLGTIEDNKIKVAFDTTLITQDETVVCFLYLDDEERTTDFYRFKFKVKVSEIDRLDTYAVKERYFSNSIIVDKVDVVTKEELKEALKGLTVSTVEGVLTETRADEIYAKKTEIPQPYDDSSLRQRVATLEERPNNNTVYDDSDLRGRVIALESKADNDTVYDDADLKRRVSELENKSDKDTVYDDSDLRGRVEALESKPDNNTVYDDSDLQGRVRALEERPNTTAYDDTDVKNRLKAIEDTQKDYVRTEDLPAPYDDRRVNERLEALETKQDNDTVYNDTDLKNRVEALENRPNNGTAYDDTDLKRRVSELEQRPDNNTVYDDTDVKERLTNLETKVDKDTVYDDSDLSNRVKALEDAPKVDVINFATKNDLVAFNGELNNKVSSVDFEDFKKTIPAPYNDKALSDRVLALENKPVTEIHGTGMPNGVVEAPIGTTYIDKNKTNGALKWIKTTDGGNTGWEVLIGDTGWRTLNSISKLTDGSKTSFIKIRRVNNLVTYQFGGLQWGWFGIIRRNGSGFVKHNSSGDKGAKVLYPGGIPEGFRSETSLVGSTYDDKGRPYGIWYLGGKTDSNFIQLTFNEDIPTDRDIGDIRVSAISYLTEEPWPTKLP